MNNRVILIVCLLMFMVRAVAGDQNADDLPELVCNYASHSMVIDGDLKEWKIAKTLRLKDQPNGSDNTMEIRSLWDHNNFYVAYTVKDNDLQAKHSEGDHKELYLDDIIELLLDPMNDKDSCWNENKLIYHINLLGQKKDDRGTSSCVSDCSWNGNAIYAVRLNGSLNNSGDVDEGYVVELSITWAEMGITPYVGLRMGADFACGDRDENENCFFDWVGANPFRSPYAFGNVILKK